MTNFTPEGALPRRGKLTADALQHALQTGEILESRALACGAQHALRFNFGACEGRMPYAECALDACAQEKRGAPALARVGRHTCFKVLQLLQEDGRTVAILSRAAAQAQCKAEYLDALRPGDILPCRVTHLAPYGAFCDVGCGVAALLPIDCLSVSRIHTPAARIAEGQLLYCVVKSRDERGRLVLTLKELLGTWLQNAAHFATGDTVAGIVRSCESYGVFIELAPNLSGLAEPCAELCPGQVVSAYIKSILPERMKIKLVPVGTAPDADLRFPLLYTQTQGHLTRWLYSPPCCARMVETVFDESASTQRDDEPR